MHSIFQKTYIFRKTGFNRKNISIILREPPGDIGDAFTSKMHLIRLYPEKIQKASQCVSSSKAINPKRTWGADSAPPTVFCITFFLLRFFFQNLMPEQHTFKVQINSIPAKFGGYKNWLIYGDFSIKQLIGHKISYDVMTYDVITNFFIHNCITSYRLHFLQKAKQSDK